MVAVQGLEPFFATQYNYLKSHSILRHNFACHHYLCTKLCTICVQERTEFQIILDKSKEIFAFDILWT